MVRLRIERVFVIAAAVAACTDFEDPEVVVDMRVLGMRAEPPEIVVPYDPQDPTRVNLADLVPVEVCALVADPADGRGLDYSMSLCRPTSSGRCSDVTSYDLGSGRVEDPETSDEPVRMCVTLEPSPDLLLVLSDAVNADDLAGFGGVSAQVALEVGPEGGGRDETLYAFKRVRYSPELPADRVANVNPVTSGFTVLRAASGERGRDFALPLGRCGEVEPFHVLRDERLQILPAEPVGARQEYAVPTFDGGARRYTENFTYQWLSTAGEWAPFESGGTIDVAGNEPPIDSIWRAPSEPDEIGDGIDVRMWIVQRDERGGQTWYDSCARVLP